MIAVRDRNHRHRITTFEICLTANFLRINLRCKFSAKFSGNVFEEVQLSLSEITSVLEDAQRSWLPVSFAVRSTGSVGRPKFEISKDQLEYLVEYELKTPDIAKALGVSVSTIKRRLREFNISS